MRLTVNGEPHDLGGDHSRVLLHVLRDELGLTGTKPACGEGVCGACTVLVDGAPTRSCVTPVGEVADRSVTTIDGLAGRFLHPVQDAFVAEQALQCGYCTPGMVLAIASLLDRDPDPTPVAIVDALDGNVCRCCAYPRILRALRRPAAALTGEDGSTETTLSDGAVDAPIDAGGTPWDRQRPEERTYFEALGDGLVVVLPPPEPGSEWAGAWTTSGGVWLHVGANGLVTAFTGKMEMGQGNSATLASIVADAVGVGVESVRMVMADTDVCPYDMGTFGSRSIPDAGAMLRAAGWTALETLVALTADRLEVSPRDLVAADGAIRSRDGARVVRYAELLAGVRRLEQVSGRPDRPAAAGRGATGRPVVSATAVAAVTGRRAYATDISLPGMLHGCELRASAAGARLVSVETSAARSLPGVTVVEEDGFVGAAAPDLRSLEAAMAAIHAEWEVPGGPSEADLTAHLRTHPLEGEDDRGFEHDAGDVDTALAEEGAHLAATYTAAYVAHVPLETRAAVAAWTGERVTVWTGTQAPFWAREELAEALSVAEDRVRVIVPPAGTGFGGKHGAGPGITAARLARAVGRPVKVRWQHPDEFARGHLRPAAIIDVRAAAAAGRITAWDFCDVNAGASAIRPPYRIANQRLRYQPAASPLPQSSYRALAATANTFARESAVDELAHALAEDPLEFRLANVDDERLAAVLAAAAERAGWPGRDRETGRGLGIACSREKEARVATCAEIALHPGGRVQIVRIITAFDCGAVIDADNLTNQVEGATVMALGPALFEAVHFADGRITNASLSTYRIPRFSDVPMVEVVLVDRPNLPSAGGGEVPLIAVAPAIANAIFAASGRRLRSMPLLPDGTIG